VRLPAGRQGIRIAEYDEIKVKVEVEGKVEVERKLIPNCLDGRGDCEKI